MSITSVHTGQSVYPSHSTEQKTIHPNTSPVSQTIPSDTVQISEEAKQLSSQSTRATEASSATLDDNDLPLEAHAIPEWFMKWTNDEVFRYVSLDGDDYIPPRNRYPEKAKQYMDTLTAHLNKVLRDQDINTPWDIYNSVIKDEEGSENVRLAMKESLANDPRMMELMNFYDINL